MSVRHHSRRMLRFAAWATAIASASIIASSAHAEVRPTINTPDGSVNLVADIHLGTNSGSPTGGVTLGSVRVFSANDGSLGIELWVTDGTSDGTRLLKDIRPGATGSWPQTFAKLGNVAFFMANDGSHGYELWKTDGTEDGTVLVKDMNPGSNGSGFLFPANYGNLLLFAGYTTANGYELWKTDGTEAGTQLVRDIEPGSASGQPAYMTVLNGSVYFQAYSSTTGAELWRSDGTTAGTTLAKDLVPGTSGQFQLSGAPQDFAIVNGKLLFSAFSGTNGRELWASDGTPENTVALGDFNTTPNGGQTQDFNPSYFAVIGSRAVFNGTGTGTGPELWITDGTAAGTTLVKDIFPGDSGGNPNFGNPFGLTAIGDKAYFYARSAGTGYEPWVTDGTELGTVPLGDLNVGAGDSMNGLYAVHEFTGYGDKVLFSAAGSGNGAEPWITDGTAAGTHILRDVAAGSSGSMTTGISSVFDDDESRSWFAVVNGRALFAANNGQTGAELWGFSSIPGSPRSVTMAASTNSVTVSWLAPASVGAAPITSYTVISNPGAFTCTTATLSCTVTGLLSNQDYTFSIVATSSIGSSEVPAISARIRTLSPQFGSLVDSLTSVTDMLSNTALRTGDTVNVLYRGFNPNEMVLLLLASNPVVIGSANADANGSVAITGVVPAATESGSHHLVLYSPVSGFGASQAVTVSVTAPTAGGLSSTGSGTSGSVVDPATLPATGRNDVPAVFALFVLVSGLLALRLRRRPLPVHGNGPR